MQLSERLQAIADEVLPGLTAADVGTDHAHVPIYLLRRRIVPRVILTDVRSGPLVKARGNLAQAGIRVDAEDIRLGSGLQPLATGEAKTVIVAGMGGHRMVDILADDVDKSLAVSRLVLQPRTHAAVLRRWITENGFTITKEQLQPERSKLSEIMTVVPGQDCGLPDIYESELDYEISPLLFRDRSPYVLQFLQAKISEARAIMEALSRERNPGTAKSLKSLSLRICELEERKTWL